MTKTMNVGRAVCVRHEAGGCVVASLGPVLISTWRDRVTASDLAAFKQELQGRTETPSGVLLCLSGAAAASPGSRDLWPRDKDAVPMAIVVRELGAPVEADWGASGQGLRFHPSSDRAWVFGGLLVAAHWLVSHLAGAGAIPHPSTLAATADRLQKMGHQALRADAT